MKKGTGPRDRIGRREAGRTEAGIGHMGCPGDKVSDREWEEAGKAGLDVAVFPARRWTGDGQASARSFGRGQNFGRFGRGERISGGRRMNGGRPAASGG